MPSVDASALSHASVDGRVPTQRSGLARQAGRVLVLAGLVVGFWLLASLMHATAASAAPAAGTPVAPIAGAGGQPTPGRLPLGPSVHGPAGTALKTAQRAEPIRRVVADLHTSVRGATVPVTRIVRTATVPVTRILRTATDPVTRTTRAARSILAGSTRRASVTVLNIVGPMAHPARPSAHPATGSGFTTELAAASAPVATEGPKATVSHATRAQLSAGQPARPDQPGRSPAPRPAPVECVLAQGGVPVSPASGGAATESLPAAASARSASRLSAPRSHTAAVLRVAGYRPSVSPD